MTPGELPAWYKEAVARANECIRQIKSREWESGDPAADLRVLADIVGEHGEGPVYAVMRLQQRALRRMKRLIKAGTLLALLLVACGGTDAPPACEVADAGPVTCEAYPWRWTTSAAQGSCVSSECPMGAECIVFQVGQVEHGVCE